MAKPKKAHYVDNKQLYAVMVEYKKAVNDSEQSGDMKPQIPNYVGRCLLQIANRLATKPNFANYTFKDDMISDGIENCLQYMYNFNPDKSKNPFAYFTQIIYYAFIRRIQKEKKQSLIKNKLISNVGVEQMMDQMIGDEAQYQSQMLDYLQKNLKEDDLKE